MARVMQWLYAVMKYGWRRAFLRPCELCGDRWRCWRWHIEVMTCPGCGRDVDENDIAHFKQATSTLLFGLPGRAVQVTGTWNTNPSRVIYGPLKNGGR